MNFCKSFVSFHSGLVFTPRNEIKRIPSISVSIANTLVFLSWNGDRLYFRYRRTEGSGARARTCLHTGTKGQGGSNSNLFERDRGWEIPSSHSGLSAPGERGAIARILSCFFFCCCLFWPSWTLQICFVLYCIHSNFVIVLEFNDRSFHAGKLETNISYAVFFLIQLFFSSTTRYNKPLLIKAST